MGRVGAKEASRSEENKEEDYANVSKQLWSNPKSERVRKTQTIDTKKETETHKLSE